LLPIGDFENALNAEAASRRESLYSQRRTEYSAEIFESSSSLEFNLQVVVLKSRKLKLEL
jgi:hypothetical protein